ncbi:MAG: DNA repair protein RecO [Eubacteriales bacterium]|nr:DNA repair protein RecO [Eubacteriales bacterium]
MSDMRVTGMITSVMKIGEYDRRIVLLTKEVGRISAFVRNARRPNSPFLAASAPFVTGVFYLYRGRDSYSVREIEVREYFSELSADIERTYYGLYFLDVANFYTRENNHEAPTLYLVFRALAALRAGEMAPALVRAVFELRMLTVHGEYPYLARFMDTKEPVDDRPVYGFNLRKDGLVAQGGRQLQKATVRAMDYVIRTDGAAVFSFAVSESVEREFTGLITDYFRYKTGHEFKSLAALSWLQGPSSEA